jgi:hypothetical protein
MSLDIYNNPNELFTSKKPIDAPSIYAETDLERIGPIQKILTEDDLKGTYSGDGFSGTSRMEFHIYSGENLLNSNDVKITYELNLKSDSEKTYDYDIVVEPEKNVRKSNISKGSFSVVYNFLNPITDKLKIENISADGTEVQLTIDSNKNQLVDTKEGFSDLYNLVTNVVGESQIQTAQQCQYVLNFGDNELSAITAFDFTLNKRMGNRAASVPFPTDVYEGTPTRFYPVENQDGYWAEVYISNGVLPFSPIEVPGEELSIGTVEDGDSIPQQEVSAPITRSVDSGGESPAEMPTTTDKSSPYYVAPDSQLGKALQTEAGKKIMKKSLEAKESKITTVYAGDKKSQSLNEKGQIQAPPGKIVGNSRFKDRQLSMESRFPTLKIQKRFRTTGRGAKFTIDVNEDFKPAYKKDGDYFRFDSDDDESAFFLRPMIDYTKLLQGKPIFNEVTYYNAQFENSNSLKTVTVKLYKPLRGDLQIKAAKIEKVVRGSYIEKLLVYPYTRKVKQNDFSEPNFKIDMGTYGKSIGTDLKSWNDLLDTNLQTSQQIVDKYISSSFDNNINVNYSDFSEFVHYSSAVERVNNFKYKAELIEGFDDRIKTLESVSGSEALTNISQSITRKNTVVSGMDGWERWMYNEPSSSLYSHYSSSAFTFQPWPKVKSQPVQLLSATSSNAIHYYNNLIESASYFDSINDARLTKTIPASLSEDPLNNDYLMFIDMIGHHFDITWSYINKLTSINSREEHPYDGMPNNLLYDVAKSMGWKLTHGKDREELWSYALGTDKFGNPVSSGSLASKPVEQYTHEIWRRIVNNIPYLLKTKGSARAVKALIATYGIPQTFLSIREYGGPMIEEVRPIWEHERFVYHLKFDGDNHMDVPFDKVNDIDPTTYFNRDPNPIDTIELQIQQNVNRDTAILNKDEKFAVRYEPTNAIATTSKKGNIHFYLSGSSGYKSASISNINIFDSQMGTLIVQREKSVDDITQDNEYKIMYRRSKKDDISVSHSASIFITGSSEPSYNAAWTGSGTVTVGKTLPSAFPGTALYMNGSIQELRYWANPLKDIVIDEHTLSRETYHGNTESSSYFDLKFRFLPDSRLKNVQSIDSQPSQHPNQKISTLLNGNIISASLYNFESDDLRGVTEEYYTKVPSAGANNIMNNKVRLEPNRLRGMLDVDERKEKSKYDTAPNDSNQLGVYLSATRMYNEDIYNHTGYFEVDNYIGSPDNREGFTEQNEELDYLRRQVFKKYSTKNLINSTIDILARYDFSVFEQIRQTVPARVDYNSGILIEPHILERPKVKSKTKVTQTQPFYKTVIKQIDKQPQMFITPLTTSLQAGPKPNKWTYPTYETSVSGGLQPNVEMFTTPLNASVSGGVAPNTTWTYPTYDNFKSLNIPNASGSIGAETTPLSTKLVISSSRGLTGENPQHSVVVSLTESLQQIAEYVNHKTSLKLQKNMKADYENNTKVSFETQKSMSGAYEQNHKVSFATPRKMSGIYEQYSNVNLTTPKNVTGNYYINNVSLVLSQSISAQKDDLESKGKIVAKTPYEASKYRYIILIASESADLGFGKGWNTGSNGSWNYNPIGTSILSARTAKYARSINYFYSSSLSASMGLSYSSSYSPSQVSTDELPLAISNLRYSGCRMTSDSITTNSDDTPDGKPVIEVFVADPNVLINTSLNANDGNLDVDASTGFAIFNLDDLYISKEVIYQRRLEYQNERKTFRREIQRLTEIETSRRDEFDIRLEGSETISKREDSRQIEYDIINDPIVVEKEIKEKAQISKSERRGLQEVRFLDGQRVNVPLKNTLIKNINPEQILKLKELQLEERENFILENKIDRRLVDKLGIALNEEDLQKIKKRGE